MDLFMPSGMYIRKENNMNLCSRCKKNPAVFYITKMEGNKTSSEGLCLSYAKELGIAPLNQMIENFGVSDDELDNLNSQMSEFMESLDERILYQLKVVGKYTGNENDIECKCLKCNRNWTQTANNLKRGNGCPYCKESKGEKEVRRILEKYEIQFNEQHTFDDCKYIKKLRFDFYIEKYNIAIEYQGIQHYEPVRFRGSKNIDENLEFEENVKRDKIKKDYCKKNNIKLLCIHYKDYESIEEIILNELKLPLTK